MVPVPNRRCYFRQRADLLVYVDLGAGNGGILHDLSEDGLFITTVGPLPGNQVIHLGFELESNACIEARGQVVWTNESGRRAGVKFIDLPERSHHLIKKWLSRNAPSGSVQENITAHPGVVESRQLESSTLQSGRTTRATRSGVAEPIDKKQPHAPATSAYAVTRSSGVTTLFPAPPSAVDTHSPEGDHEVVRVLRSALSQEQIGPEQAARNHRLRRKWILGGISGFLAVLALVSWVALFRSQHWQMGFMVGEIRKMIADVFAPSDVEESTEATTHSEKPKLRPRRRGPSRVQPGGQGQGSTASPAGLPGGVNEAGNRADTFQVEVLDANNQRRLIKSGTPVITVKSSATGVRVSVPGAKPTVAAATAPEATSVPTSNAPRGGVSQEISGGILKERVMPTYPVLALEENVQGSVVLQALIGKDGTVQNVRLISGSPILASAVMEAVKQWRYEPYYRNGEPVEVEIQITVDFTISTK